MRVVNLAIETFVVKASEDNAETEDGVLVVTGSKFVEDYKGNGFAALSKVDGSFGGYYDTNHTTVYRTNIVNVIPGKMTFSGSLSAPTEDSKLTYAHGVLITEISNDE